jgi:hypothetical protein
LAGIVIPGSLIASSVQEFSFIDSYKTPFPFLLNTMTQAAGFFLFWPIALYFLFSGRIKTGIAAVFSLLAFYSLANTFLVHEHFGFLTNTLIFSEPKPFLSTPIPILTNIGILALVTAFLAIVTFLGKKTALASVQIIAIVSLVSLGLINTVQTITAFNIIREDVSATGSASSSIKPFFSFSTEGKNIVVIMLDRGIAGYINEMFSEKPELASAFSGFTWYPNCVSFANHTLVGAPALYGGYEYSPAEINRHEKKSVFEKHRESYLLLPRLFAEAGYSIAINDPPFDSYLLSNLAVFQDYPAIKADNLTRKYTGLWLQSHPEVSGLNIGGILKNNLIRFSFFKIAPLVFRNFIYDAGDWLTTTYLGKSTGAENSLAPVTIDDYALLDFLPELTTLDHSPANYFNEVYGHLPHSPAFFQFPDYKPVTDITDTGHGPFSHENNYHVNIASFLLLAEWFRYLQENGAYNNTRIIIASDHGAGRFSNYENNITLPNGESLETYHCLLLFKDFNGSGALKKDYTFMSNADTSLLALDGIIPNPVNPFTGKPLTAQKEDGLFITTIGALDSRYHAKNRYRIHQNQWLHVRDTIFDSANWSQKGPE